MKLNNNIKFNIRKENIPYIITWMLYYAWVVVFTTWWTSSPTTDKIMGADSRVLLHSLNLISSAIFVFIIKKEWFKKSSYIGGILVILFSILSVLKLNPIIHIITIIMLLLSLGLVNISILIPMIYSTNNDEKIISIIGSNVLISVLILLQEYNILTVNNGFILSYIILILSLVAIFKFKKDIIQKNNYQNKVSKNKLNKTMYLSIIINCIYAIICKGIGKALLVIAAQKSLINLYPIYYIGGIVGCLVFYIIYRYKKANNYVSWNIIFGLFATSMFIYSNDSLKEIDFLFAFIMGIVSTMGMINMYYTLTSIGKKYNNHLYIKTSILSIGLLGGISGSVFGNHISNLNLTKVSILLSLAIIIIIVLLLVISPTLSNSYDQIEVETEKNKTTIKNNCSKYKLTKKEEELCNKLIEGFTLKQASAMMGIKYNTANGYYKNIYKKLDVNSKIELLNKINKI